MVHRFYDDVWNDPMLGPIFKSRVDENRDEHLAKMCDFWSSILLGSRRFHGNPMATHAGIPEITKDHFEHWLTLFRKTVDSVFEAPAADNVFLRATHMRRALERVIVDKKDPATSG